MATLVLTPLYGDEASHRLLNMWFLKRCLDAAGVAVEYCRRTLKGTFILQLTPDQSPDGLIGDHNINGVEVKITMPRHLNVVKAIIHHPELGFMDSEVVAEMLEEDGVVAVQKPPEATYAVLSWNRSTGTSLPATVLVGWDRVRVKTLQPRPRRCYCCQGYGHIARDCTKTPVCSRCGEEHEEEDTECQKQPRCAACNGPHSVTDHQCPVWQEEKAVAKVRQEKKLSYSEALKTVKKQEKKKEDTKKTEENK